MVIQSRSLRARRQLRAAVRVASGGYRWLDTPLGSTAVARVGVLALSIVGAYVALRVYPTELPAPERHPDFLATVFQSRPIVFAGRITILCIAAFAICSIAARMWNKQWLAKAGPFEIERVAFGALNARDEIKEEVERAHAAIEDLSARIEGSRAAVRAVRGHIATINQEEEPDHGLER